MSGLQASRVLKQGRGAPNQSERCFEVRPVPVHGVRCHSGVDFVPVGFCIHEKALSGRQIGSFQISGRVTTTGSRVEWPSVRPEYDHTPRVSRGYLKRGSSLSRRISPGLQRFLDWNSRRSSAKEFPTRAPLNEVACEFSRVTISEVPQN